MNVPEAVTRTDPLAVVVDPLNLRRPPSGSVAVTRPRTAPLELLGAPTAVGPGTGSALPAAVLSS
ncbi:MAG: hypothetical protein PGN37_05935 [Mycobacterium kyogaense]|uniref:hypothetical protein n=1 Tax=Mycobacterium kyogaense TaxID=2212479 RepID=UPI002FF90933